MYVQTSKFERKPIIQFFRSKVDNFPAAFEYSGNESVASTLSRRESKPTAAGTAGTLVRDPKSMASEPKSMARGPKSMAWGSESMARGSNSVARGSKSMANVGTKSSELESIRYRKKSRRGFNRKGKGNISLTLSILGNNVDGLKNKVESLLNNISCFKPSIITLQETNN